MYQENKQLKERVKLLEDKLKRINLPKNTLQTSDPLLNSSRLNTILQEAEEAMERYTKKLRKERLKHAKQKQS